MNLPPSSPSMNPPSSPSPDSSWDNTKLILTNSLPLLRRTTTIQRKGWSTLFYINDITLVLPPPPRNDIFHCSMLTILTASYVDVNLFNWISEETFNLTKFNQTTILLKKSGSPLLLTIGEVAGGGGGGPR